MINDKKEEKKQRVENIGFIVHEEMKYRTKMCKNCKFFINNICIKHRNVRTCAVKGLKNRE